MTAALVLPDDGIVDDVAVERVIAGRHVPLRPAERLEVALRMHARGNYLTEIADALHVSNRTVRALMACLLDERARHLVDGGPCDQCRGTATWQVTYPDGAVRELCLTHAARALGRLDEAAA